MENQMEEQMVPETVITGVIELYRRLGVWVQV